MLRAQKKPPEYHVIQWHGENLDEVADFVSQTSGRDVCLRAEDRSLVIRSSAPSVRDRWVPLNNWLVVRAEQMPITAEYGVYSPSTFRREFRLADGGRGA